MAAITLDPDKPETWTAEYAWSLIDQVPLKARLRLIDTEMRRTLKDSQWRIWVESVNKGSVGYAPRDYLKEEQLIAEEWAEKQAQAALATWQAQGYEPCLAFWYAVNTNLLGQLFDSRTRAASGDMSRRNHIERKRVGSDAFVGSDALVRKFERNMMRLRTSWRQKIEILGREANHSLMRKARDESARGLLLTQAQPAIAQTTAAVPAQQDAATTAEARYKPNTVRREAGKLNTLARHKGWRSACSSLEKSNPGKPDVWYAQKIAEMDVADGRNASTIRKHMRD